MREIERLRRGAGDALALALPEPEAGLAAGILIGLRDLVDRDLAATFTAAGVSHVVAISGWNIAIVALLVDAALRSAPRRRRRLVTLAAIAIYTVLTGASASVLRAAAMAVAVTLARETGRAGTALHALALAVAVMLVIDPAIIGDAGFQLSALATAGLVAWATPMTDWLRARGNGRLPEWLCVGLGVSLAAQAATLPVVLASFGRLAALSPLLNLAVVPLVPLAMAGGAVALVVGGLGMAGLPAAIATVLAVPGWLPLAALTGIVRFGAGLPLASVTIEPPLNLRRSSGHSGGDRDPGGAPLVPPTSSPFPSGRRQVALGRGPAVIGGTSPADAAHCARDARRGRRRGGAPGHAPPGRPAPDRRARCRTG